VEKYRARVSALEDKVKHILQEEWEERTLNRAENQANRAEKILKGQAEIPRSWFQSDDERKLEKSMYNLMTFIVHTCVELIIMPLKMSTLLQEQAKD
jgi:hypothetical protein